MLFVSQQAAAWNDLSHFFKSWVFIFTRDIIELSNKYPETSGFYKIMNVILRVCEKHDYFGNFQVKEDNEGDVVMDKKVERSVLPSEENVIFLRKLITKFLQNVVVRIKTFRDELLYAAIEMVLNVPKQFIDIPNLMPALQSCLKIGLNYLPAGKLCMDVLERWLVLVPDAMQTHLPSILPKLADYIRASSYTFGDEKIQLDSKHQGKKLENPETVLIHRILGFLGKVGGASRYVLKQESLEKGYMRWDPEDLVKYPISFPEYKLDIYLDSLLPRLAYLAESSSNRQTKIGACEALHSIMIWMISQRAIHVGQNADVCQTAI